MEDKWYNRRSFYWRLLYLGLLRFLLLCWGSDLTAVSWSVAQRWLLGGLHYGWDWFWDTGLNFLYWGLNHTLLICWLQVHSWLSALSLGHIFPLICKLRHLSILRLFFHCSSVKFRCLLSCLLLLFILDFLLNLLVFSFRASSRYLLRISVRRHWLL